MQQNIAIGVYGKGVTVGSKLCKQKTKCIHNVKLAVCVCEVSLTLYRGVSCLISLSATSTPMTPRISWFCKTQQEKHIHWEMKLWYIWPQGGRIAIWDNTCAHRKKSRTGAPCLKCPSSSMSYYNQQPALSFSHGQTHYAMVMFYILVLETKLNMLINMLRE